jgi:hypothetical protein
MRLSVSLNSAGLAEAHAGELGHGAADATAELKHWIDRREGAELGDGATDAAAELLLEGMRLRRHEQVDDASPTRGRGGLAGLDRAADEVRRRGRG